MDPVEHGHDQHDDRGHEENAAQHPAVFREVGVILDEKTESRLRTEHLRDGQQDEAEDEPGPDPGEDLRHRARQDHLEDQLSPGQLQAAGVVDPARLQHRDPVERAHQDRPEDADEDDRRGGQPEGRQDRDRVRDQHGRRERVQRAEKRHQDELGFRVHPDEKSDGDPREDRGGERRQKQPHGVVQPLEQLAGRSSELWQDHAPAGEQHRIERFRHVGQQRVQCDEADEHRRRADRRDPAVPFVLFRFDGFLCHIQDKIREQRLHLERVITMKPVIDVEEPIMPSFLKTS